MTLCIKGRTTSRTSLTNIRSTRPPTVEDVLLRFPLCADAGPFSGLLQSGRCSGKVIPPTSIPAMQVVHAFEGWPMERDIRNQIRHATIAVRRLDPAMRFAWLVRLGIASIRIFGRSHECSDNRSYVASRG
jgi:hypothetical protein